MNISLDYDQTYTVDPELYLAFVETAIERGHNVYVVTMRTPAETQSMDPALCELVTKVIPTSRQAKREFVEKSHGIKIDVWVDDEPRAILELANQIWK